MEIFLLATLFLLGLAIGSFLNVLIYRLNAEDAPKFWKGRSLCPHCKHTLVWKDNIPLLSFIRLKGKCRYCHKKISWQYPTVELVTATSFVLLGIFVQFDLIYYVVTCVFIVIFFSDLIYGLIPDEMVITGSVAALIFNLFASQSSFGAQLPITKLIPYLLIGLASSLAFFLIVLVTRFRGMGLGDVKLVFFLGLLLGWPKMLVGLWVSFVLGGLVAIFLLLLKRTKLSATIPLGPFLIIGTVIAGLWSNNLLHLIGL